MQYTSVFRMIGYFARSLVLLPNAVVPATLPQLNPYGDAMRKAYGPKIL